MFDALKEVSLFKKLFAVVIIGTIIGLFFYNPYDKDYVEQVDREIRLAAAICEESTDWVLGNRARLKLDEATLEHITLGGQKVELEHVKYPRVLFFHDGFDHPRNQVDLVCYINDPRGASEYFFDYNNEVWLDRSRMRR